MKILNKIAGGIRRPLLVDPSGTKYTDKGARKIYSNASDTFLSVALLVKNRRVKLMANFFVGLDKPKDYPVKIFTEEDEAIKWLKEFINGVG